MLGFELLKACFLRFEAGPKKQLLITCRTEEGSLVTEPKEGKPGAVGKHDRLFFLISLLLFVVGFLLCAYLVSLSFVPDAGKFCEVFKTDCLGVITSGYSKIFIFSSSSIGLAYFAFQLIILFGYPLIDQRIGRLPLPLLMITGSMAFGASCYYIYLFLFVVPDTCIACYGVHFINFLFFVFCLLRCFGFLKSRVTDWRGAFGGRGWLVLYCSAVTPLIILLAVTLAETRFQLQFEQQKGSKNLSFAQYLHHTAPKHKFEINKEDAVYGSETALHEIVLIYKKGCGQCRRAKEKLIPFTQGFPDAVYLVLKNFSTIPKTRLKELQVKHVPMVFVNGREAKGWDLPGFFDEYLDCGC